MGESAHRTVCFNSWNWDENGLIGEMLVRSARYFIPTSANLRSPPLTSST